MSRAALLAVLLALPLSVAAREPPRHIALKRSVPSNESRLAAAPARISLWFTTKPQLAFTRVRLSSTGGETALDTIVADTGNAVHARVPGRLAPGAYRVHWQTASADGHPIRGEFTFTVLGAADAPVVAAQPAPPTRVDPSQAGDSGAVPAIASEFRSVRWLEFAALVAVLGVLGFRHGVLPPLAVRGVLTSDAADRARRLGRWAIALYAASVVVRLVAESVALHGAEAALQRGTMIPLLTSTTWGVGWILGAVGAVLLLIGWSLPRRPAAVIGTPLALTGALGMVLAPALSGHAAASRQFVTSVTLDALHVAAAGLWIGGLLMILTVGVPAMRRLTDGNQDAAVRALVSSFHPLALLCAPIVVVAGLGTSLIRLGGVAGLSTLYGRTLAIKLGLFACVAGMGAYNAFRARRRLGTPEGTRHFRGTASVELALAALVLAATTFLVVSPVPADMSSMNP